jgi:hypothetical protein
MKAKITTKILKTAVLIVALLALGSNVRSDVQFNVPWAGIRDQLVKQLRQDGWILVTDDRDEMNPMFTRDRSGGDWKVIDWLSCSFVPQGHGMPIRFVVEKNEVRFWNTVNGYKDVTQRDAKAVEDLVTKAVKAYWDDVKGGHHAEHP